MTKSKAPACLGLADRIAAKRREIEASGLCQWSYRKPEQIAPDAFFRCRDCQSYHREGSACPVLAGSSSARECAEVAFSGAAGCYQAKDLPSGSRMACPKCAGSMELVKASEGGRIGQPFLRRYQLRDGDLGERSRPASFWACGCDHCEEA